MLDFINDLSDWAINLLKQCDVWDLIGADLFDCANASDAESLLSDWGFDEQLYDI